MEKGSEQVTNLVDDRNYDAALTALRDLVASGIRIDDIRDTRYSGNPPIWVRMLDDGRGDAAKFAILSGADVNARSCIGEPVLSIAAAHGFGEVVELLIRLGADVNPQSKHDDPLSSAAKKGHGAIVDALLVAGANPNSVNEYGHTPLMAAAISGDVGILRRLDSAGANPKTKDKMGRTAMYYAVANQRTAAMEYLTGVEAGSARPERLQAIVSFSRRPISKWDVYNLHDEIERSQNEMGRVTDRAAFRARHVVAGEHLADEAYVYAQLREHLADLGGHELMSRCCVHEFRASDGNEGKYVVLLDRVPEGG